MKVTCINGSARSNGSCGYLIDSNLKRLYRRGYEEITVRKDEKPTVYIMQNTCYI